MGLEPGINTPERFLHDKIANKPTESNISPAAMEVLVVSETINNDQPLIPHQVAGMVQNHLDRTLLI